MNKHMIKKLSVILVIILVVIIFTTGNNSYSIGDEVVSLSMYTDKHVSKGEKVFLNIEGNYTSIESINLDLKCSNNTIFVDVFNIYNKPYFTIPDGADIKEGDICKLGEYRVVLGDNKEHIFNSSNSNYIKIDNNVSYNAWRDFANIIINNNMASYNGNFYFNMIADTKDIVSITVNLSGTEDIVTYAENIDSRPFINIDKVGEYYIKDFTIYYKDGGYYTYNVVDDKSLGFINIDNNKIIVNYLEDYEASRDIKTAEYESTNDTTTVNDFSSSNYVWMFVLVVLILAAVVLFYLIKSEE